MEGEVAVTAVEAKACLRFEVDEYLKRTISHGTVAGTLPGKLLIVAIPALLACSAFLVSSLGNPFEKLDPVILLLELFPALMAVACCEAVRTLRNWSRMLSRESLSIEGNVLIFWYRRRYDYAPQGIDVIMADLARCTGRYDEKTRKVFLEGEVRHHHYQDLGKERVLTMEEMERVDGVRMYPYYSPDLVAHVRTRAGRWEG